VAVTLVAALAALGISRLEVPRYESSAQLFVSTANTPESSGGLSSGGLYSQQRMASYAQLAKTQQLAQKVVDATKLPITAEQLVAETTVVPASDTVVLTLVVNDTSPEMARDLANGLAEQLAKLISELETAPGSDVPFVQTTIVQKALLPSVPVSPRTKRNVVFAGLLGLIIGTALALLRAHFDTRLRNSADVAESTGRDLIGAIPRTKERVVNFSKGPSATAEAFRQTRTKLLYADVKRAPRVITVTCSTTTEDKTMVAVNLALALAETGSTVALVEGDLRRPRTATYMGLSDDVGLTNVLAGAATIDDAIQATNHQRVKVLGSGPLRPNPSELLGSQQMVSTIDTLRKRFAFIVIDAPPLLPVTDGAVLATISDGAIVVARYGHTKATEARRAVEILEALDCIFLGAILTMVPARSKRDHDRERYAFAPEAIHSGSSGTLHAVKPEPVARSKSGEAKRWSVLRGSGNGKQAATEPTTPTARHPHHGDD
jgi:receptor protein-tyrosine kinase